MEKTKGTVIMMSNVKKITNVELTTAKICLALSLFMIVAMIQRKVFVHLKISVILTKVIAMIMMSVQKDSSVD